jgi:hypothetical protein
MSCVLESASALCTHSLLTIALYTRISKIKVFNNREGFLGLFNCSEMRIVAAFIGTDMLVESGVITISDLMGLTAEQYHEKLDATLAEICRFTQSHSLVDRVRDDQSLTLGEADMLVYQSEAIPDVLEDADRKYFLMIVATIWLLISCTSTLRVF